MGLDGEESPESGLKGAERQGERLGRQETKNGARLIEQQPEWTLPREGEDADAVDPFATERAKKADEEENKPRLKSARMLSAGHVKSSKAKEGVLAQVNSREPCGRDKCGCCSVPISSPHFSRQFLHRTSRAYFFTALVR